ncbi:CpaF family protein [Nioella ostreopsis]|uniref:CpaF family protein n=1 Tax=Nioella ostreopsis TaxID=2448479 RepID=UPI000FDB6126|nr:CpaF family protein [Nioella ostreopsis]
MFGKKNSIASTAGFGMPSGAFQENSPSTSGFEILDSSSEDNASIEQEDAYRDLRRLVFSRLIEELDAARLLRGGITQGRALIAAALDEIIISDKLKVSAAEEERLLNEISDDMLGFGPLERFLTQGNITEIMVNGTEPIYVEIDGVLRKTDVRFRDTNQLLNVCQSMVSLVGRRVDEASPICDARLKDGSRVNVIIPPVSINGPSLTIRLFRQDVLTVDQMVSRGVISAGGAELLRILARCRCNILIIGGTGSGKTTMLNALTGYIEAHERIVTCEDTAELRLQQPHVVRLETRPPNVEGKGQIPMRDLVRNCLRMRPDRIIVGEVRGPEAFDLLQAMNTGHDGSMSTLHANSPEDAVSRMTALVTMGFSSLGPDIIQEMFQRSIDVIIHVERHRDGSRRITHVTEVLDEGPQEQRLRNLIVFKTDGEQVGDKIVGQHRATAYPVGEILRRSEQYGETRNLMRALARDGLQVHEDLAHAG